MAARKLTRREITLLITLAIVAVVMIYLGQGDSGSRVGGGSLAEGEDNGLGDAPVVDLARLRRDAESYDAGGRDLFKYGQRPPTPWELANQQERDAAARRRQEEQARKRRETQPPPRAPQPVRQAPERLPEPGFTYLGYLGPKDNKIAVFEKSALGEDEDPLLLARTGEVLEERFLLQEINFQSVVIGYTEDRYRGKTTELSMRKGASRGGPSAGGRRGRRR